MFLGLAKNQLRFEIFEKILKCTYKNQNGKLIFYPFSLSSSRSLAACWFGEWDLAWGVVDQGLGGRLAFAEGGG